MLLYTELAIVRPAMEAFAEQENVIIGLPNQSKVNVIPDLSNHTTSDEPIESISILGRLFQVSRSKPKVLIVVTNSPEDPLFHKFIIPTIGLDMPIYKLVVGLDEATDGASAVSTQVELVDKRQINRTL